MAKKKNKTPRSGIQRWIQQHPDLSIVIALILLIYGFFAPVIFTVGSFASSDMITNLSLRPYVSAVEARGEYPQWIPYIFSGMPSYGALLVTGTRWWDFFAMIVFGIAQLIGAMFQSDVARIATYYAIYAVGMYLLMRSKQHQRFVAAFTAIAAVFSTFVIVWVMIGHNTKPAALMTYPYILLLLERLQQRFRWIIALFLILALHTLAESSHMQLIFYAMITFALYILVELIVLLKQKRPIMPLLKAASWLVIAAAISVAMSADRYLSVQEYTPYSTRGSASILASDSLTVSDGGLDYEYATNWSFSPEEMITFLIPNYFGFGKLPYKGPLTGNREIHLHTYWGQMPFTDAANYMGIGVLIFAIFGILLYRREPMIWFLVILSIIALLLSFGRTFPLLYDVFFYYVPLFNKFRTPSMALVMLQFAVPILAGYGISGILQRLRTHPQSAQQMLRIAFFATLLFFASSILFSLLGKEAYLEAVKNSATGKQLPASLHHFIYQKMITDWMVTALLAMGFVAIFIAYARKKLAFRWFITLLFALLIVDLWRVAVRPMEIPERSLEETVFRETDIVRFLKSDTTLFRILDFTAPSPNYPAYFFLHHAHGYSSAKMRTYQDLLDVAGKGGGNVILNPFLWDLLNVKYLIVNQQLPEELTGSLQLVAQSQEKQAFIYHNRSVLPRFFFVDSIVVESSPLRILERLRDGDFNPRQIAFVETPISETIQPVRDAATVNVLSYQEHRIILQTQTSAPHFLFIGDPHYPPGWHAQIDGQPVKIYKTNYVFRGIVVPAGQHRIELWYESTAFTTGKHISLATNIAFTLLFFGLWLYQKRQLNRPHISTEQKRNE